MPLDKSCFSIRLARSIAERLLRASPAVQAAFLAWESAGTPPELCVAGYTVERLMREHGMKPMAALLTLDWLAREHRNEQRHPCARNMTG